MNNKWLIIIFVLLIGLGSLYLIVESSNTVGSAIMGVSKYTVTLPDGFSNAKAGDETPTMVNGATKETIVFKDLGKEKKMPKIIKSEYDNLTNNDEIEILKNTTNNTQNNVHTIIYKNLTNDENYSMIFFTKFNHGFSLKIWNYISENELIDHVNFIINTMQPDYKQKQD